MNVPNLKRMTAEEYADWAGQQPTGRYELIDGMVVQMNSETAAHARVKLNVALAFREKLRALKLAGEVFGDGIAVKVSDKVVHEPDALLRLGTKLADNIILVTDPVIVVEVLSPRSGPIDTGVKLANYFKIATVQHYLVVNTIQRAVQHFVRDNDGWPVMRPLITEGDIPLDPPGLVITMDEIFEE